MDTGQDLLQNAGDHVGLAVLIWTPLQRSWREDPTERPTVDEVVTSLEVLLRKTDSACSLTRCPSQQFLTDRSYTSSDCFSTGKPSNLSMGDGKIPGRNQRTIQRSFHPSFPRCGDG